MRQLDYILTQLAQSFTARDLMVPRDKLECGTDQKTAQQKLLVLPQYDVVPIKQKDRLTAFLERDKSKAEFIFPQHVISDATSIFDLVDLFQTRKFFFVVTGNDVAGLVHFADLNNHLVKIPFFVLLGTLEDVLLQVIDDYLTEELLQEVLDTETWSNLKKKFKKLRSNDAELGYGNLLQFSHVVDLARHLKHVQLSTTKRDAIINVRNRVSHGTDPLVEKYEHVRRLGDAKETAFRLLNELDGN